MSKPHEKKMYDLLELAIELAVFYHKGQKDKAGKPYILHCLRVMNSCASVEAKIVGVLHDILEDTDLTLQELIEFGYPNFILDALVRLTKPKDKVVDNNDYLQQISYNLLATEVKMADLKDNLDLLRLEKIDKSNIKRINKYIESYKYLEGV